MNRMLMGRCVRLASIALAAFAAGLCRQATAAPLDDRVPADAVVYVGWAGADALTPQYNTSNLKGIIEASTIKDFIDKQLPKLEDQAAHSPDDAKNMERAKQLLSALWRHPAAFYLRGVDFSKKEPVPSLGIMVDAGTDAKAITDMLHDLMTKNPPPPEQKVHVQTDGTLIILSTGSDDTPADLRKNGGLAGNAAYKAAMNRVKQANIAMAFYGDAAAGLGIVKTALQLPDTPREAREKVPAVLDALGLNSLTQMAIVAGFDGKGWAEQSYVGIKGPRNGLLSLVGNTPLSDAVFALVPKDSAAFMASKFDLHKLFTEIRAAVGKVDANAQTQFDQAVEQVNAELKFDIDKDFLATLGDEWVVYRGPGDAGGMTMALVQHLRDPEHFAQSLAALEDMFNQRVAAGNGQIAKIQKVTAAKTEVSSVAVLNYSLAWGVKNGNLYISTLDGIGPAIKQVENKLPSIVENPDYKAAMAALNVPANVKPTSIAYSNPAKLYPDIRRQVLGVLPLLRQNGVDVPNDLFPDPDDVAKFMTPGAQVGWADADGMHTLGKSAFPGAEIVGGQQMSPASIVPVAALGTAILLPSLGRARETANRTVDMANLGGIAKASVVHAADNDDKMPDDLARLVLEGAVSPKGLVSPGSGTQPLPIPPDLLQKMNQNGQIPRDDYLRFAADLAAHTDYVYIAGGTTNQTDAGIVVIFEKPSPRATQGLNVAFQDGHAEFVHWKDMEDTFKKTNEMLRKMKQPEIDVKAMMKRANVTLPAAGSTP